MVDVSRCLKIPFESRAEAKQFAKGAGGQDQRPYMCRDCDKWHLTGTSKRHFKASRRRR